MAILRIVKRTGDIVPFDRGRIHGAVTKAIRAAGAPVEPSRIHAIVDGVVAEADTRFGEAPPTVEHVQDLVEKALVREGLYEVAKAYILYRADRQRERDAQRAAAVERARLGRLTVRTRDGATVPFDTARLVAAVTARVGDLAPDVSVDALVGEALRTIFDGMATTQIERALVLAAAAFIERDPAYSVAASRLLLDALYREVTQASPSDGDREARYRDAFAAGLRRGIGSGLYDARLSAFDHAALAAALRPERDALLQYLGVQTLADRYLARDDGRTVELPQAFWMRVAMGLAVDEDEPADRAIAFYDIMSTLRYVPSTPTLFHAGTPRPQLSSCYLTTVQDDLAHIFKSLGDNAQLSKWSGGLGNDWTSIRGTGARIASTRVESQGVVPFLKVANDVTMAINRSGKRRGATCAYLEAWHYDIEDFLELRRNTGDERRRTHDMNTAVWIPDLFMQRVEADGPWTLFSPDEVPDLHEIYGRAFAERYREAEARAARGELHLHRTVPAAALWRKMLTMLFETGHPWITFKDPCNVRSPQDHAGVVHSSNLCTEITLNTSVEETAVCNLGSVNLARHVVDGRLDEAALGDTVSLAMRMLDNVVDINFYPTPEARTSNLRHRPVGLGLMGWQDTLFDLDLPFDAPEAVALADRTMEVISYHAILASSRLAARARTGRVVWRLEVGTRPAAVRHAGPARRRARHAGGREPDAAAGLGAGLRQRRRARHAQLEHDGHRPDRDHRQHRRLLSLHRADLPQHLRQGQHQRRVHDRQRAPGPRSQGARAVERRHARPPEVLRRQPADDRRRAGPPEGEVPARRSRSIRSPRSRRRRCAASGSIRARRTRSS